jgi:hypothetical protein
MLNKNRHPEQSEGPLNRSADVLFTWRDRDAIVDPSFRSG